MQEININAPVEKLTCQGLDVVNGLRREAESFKECLVLPEIHFANVVEVAELKELFKIVMMALRYGDAVIAIPPLLQNQLQPLVADLHHLYTATPS